MIKYEWKVKTILVSIFSNSILKVGVASMEDGQKLHAGWGLVVQGCVDLRYLAIRGRLERYRYSTQTPQIVWTDCMWLRYFIICLHNSKIVLKYICSFLHYVKTLQYILHSQVTEYIGIYFIKHLFNGLFGFFPKNTFLPSLEFMPKKA